MSEDLSVFDWTKVPSPHTNHEVAGIYSVFGGGNLVVGPVSVTGGNHKGRCFDGLTFGSSTGSYPGDDGCIKFEYVNLSGTSWRDVNTGRVLFEGVDLRGSNLTLDQLAYARVIGLENILPADRKSTRLNSSHRP